MKEVLYDPILQNLASITHVFKDEIVMLSYLGHLDIGVKVQLGEQVVTNTKYKTINRKIKSTTLSLEKDSGGRDVGNLI